MTAFPQSSRTILVLGLLLLTGAAQAAENTDALYVKEDTWAATMQATQQRYADWRDRFQLGLGPWHATKPLPAKDFAQTHVNPAAVDLEAKDEAGKALWQEQADWKDGKVVALPPEAPASSYLWRTITVGSDNNATAWFGSDDGIQVWLNGKEVHAKDVPRVAAPRQDCVVLPLQAGENELLVKIYNRLGGHGFYFSADSGALADAWKRMTKDFPRQTNAMQRDLPGEGHLAWFDKPDAARLAALAVDRAAADELPGAEPLKAERAKLESAHTAPTGPAWLALYARASMVRDAAAMLAELNVSGLEKAVRDLAVTHGDSYAKGGAYLASIDEFKQTARELTQGLAASADEASFTRLAKEVAAMQALRREALLANPLLDFGRLLVVRRKSNRLGLPQNWQGNCAIPRSGYDNEIAILSGMRGEPRLETVYKPDKPWFVGDVDLHFDGDRMLFSMPGSHGRWQIWEAGVDGSGLRQVTPGTHDFVDNYDACYVPDGSIIFASTRCIQGIPCVGGGNTVANLCRLEQDGSIRQLCFDQDHNWCPVMLNNGRVLFSRWEYSDTPHYFSRLLFHMNPDGTGQMEYYGSNSYWPNSLFYARPIPGHPTQVAGIVSGHHGVPRMGELVLFDPAEGRFEADGAVRRICGHETDVEPIIVDQLVNGSWPKFLHPYPLSGKYFLVSCQPAPSSNWGLYLADIYDNLQLIHELPGQAIFEPVPLQPTPEPPVMPPKVNTERDDAVVYLVDVYAGRGLEGVPRGTVKKLRVFEIYYTYPKMGGHIHIGVEGPWDVHRILGTVPVFEDGSAVFRVPANTPIAVQPLDAEGKAVQVMRSWFTAMPGETLQCVGCHERQNAGPPVRRTIAASREPCEIEPWYGPARGFSFKRDVQPVLDEYCVGCHDGKPKEDGHTLPDFTAKDGNGWKNFTPSYLALHPYVRRPGPESDYHLPVPLEWHADTSPLVQMLERNHKGVRLDAEAMDRIVTWIDLNVPDHGTWSEHQQIPGDFHKQRLEMRTKYANLPEDPEVIPALEQDPVTFRKPEPLPSHPEAPPCEGWPFDAATAKKLQKDAGAGTEMNVDLGGGVTMTFSLIPAGSFVMGVPGGSPLPGPPSVVRVESPFWLGRTEVTLDQYHRFEPRHSNGYFDQHHKDHTRPGYDAGGPDKPVIRVSWQQAMAFCEWMSAKTGQPFRLPTEAEWEWACRAGSDAALYYGGLDTDFSPHANLADISLREMAVTGVDPQPMKNPNEYFDFLPKDPRFNDKAKLMAPVAQYQPNPWGLYDMHGNAAEWTLSICAPYPYDGADGRNRTSGPEDRAVRGGSWRDKPQWARAAMRLPYRPYQRVFNVGFRVACPVTEAAADSREVARLENAVPQR